MPDNEAGTSEEAEATDWVETSFEAAGAEAVVADPDRLKTLSDALQNDQVAAWAAVQPQPWGHLQELPPR